MIEGISGQPLFNPYIGTGTEGPGTLPPPAQAQAAPLDDRRTSAIDSLLGKGNSEPVRKRMQEILTPYPTGELEALRKHGLQMVVTQGKAGIIGALARGSNAVALGGYIPLLRKVFFDEAVLMSDAGPHMVIHELAHVVDHMRGDKASMLGHIPVLRNVRPFVTGVFESQQDAQTRQLYAEFNARANVEDVDGMRREIEDENHGTLPANYTYVSDDGWGERHVDYQRKDGQEIFHLGPVLKKHGHKRLAKAAVGTALLVGGLALAGPVVATMGGLLLGGSALGLLREKMAERRPPTPVDVDLKTGGAHAHVLQKNDEAVVTVPEGARSYLGDVWSEYAHRGAGVYEYMAEATATLLEGGDKAAIFKQADPKMYAFVEKRLQNEFNSHP